MDVLRQSRAAKRQRLETDNNGTTASSNQSTDSPHQDTTTPSKGLHSVQVPASSPISPQLNTPLEAASPSTETHRIDASPLESDAPSQTASSTASPFPMLFGAGGIKAMTGDRSFHKKNGRSEPVRRLDSLSSNRPNLFDKFAYSPNQQNLQNGRIQRGPAPALPVSGGNRFSSPVDLTRSPDQLLLSGPMMRLKHIYPNLPTQMLLNSLERARGDFDLAASSLSQAEASLRRQLGSNNNTSSSNSNNSNHFRRTALPVDPGSKRDIKKAQKSIRDKFSTVTTGSFVSAHHTSQSPPAPQRPKRKLMRGSKQSSAKLSSEGENQSEPEILELIDSDDSSVEGFDNQKEESIAEDNALKFFNDAGAADIADIACCSTGIAETIVSKRPFSSLEDIRLIEDPATTVTQTNTGNNKTGKRRGAGKRAAGNKIVDTCIETLRGYDAVDSLIQKCEVLGEDVAKSIRSWGVQLTPNSGEVEITEIDPHTTSHNGGTGFFSDQPKLLAPDVQLKDYQQVGINWLTLLYNKGLSCILADEMGLGKTCQVIAFLAHLYEQGERGPHLVVVPSSTLENWLREFNRFCPTLVVEPYYGSQQERAELREKLWERRKEFNVLVTTYALATGQKPDFGFLRSLKFNICVYDEGHLLKNSASDRYNKLMRLPANFRLLLTGTPLQNNLQELISLLSFILPDIFEERKEDLIGIFKNKAKTNDDPDRQNMALLSQQRILRAKTMMTPFVLRRKKQQVLQHLPAKTHAVEYCELTEPQKVIYDEEMESSRKVVEARRAGQKLKKGEKSSANVLMQLRKAALHQLLFRRIYTTSKLKKMAKQIMKEDQYMDANEQYIFEDMQVMTDFELNRLCEQFASINSFALKNQEWMDSGKVQKLSSLLGKREQDDRFLIFSQFTQVLDILERVLSTLKIAFVRLDGQTPVDVRQDIIDKFYEEKDITVFLLSTRAGGFGINLACANKVIIFDLSFNPHDDKQAEDRAHRVGQTRTVHVIRLITKGTVEEAILSLANTKLALDKSLSEDSGSGTLPSSGTVSRAQSITQDDTEEKGASLVEKMIFK